MIRPISALAAGALVLMAATSARAGEVSASALSDNYVKRNNSGPYHGDSVMLVKNKGSKKTTRKALIQFSSGNIVQQAFEATLSLDVASMGSASSAKINVFGIDPTAGLFNDIHECDALLDSVNDLRYGDDELDFLDDSDDGVDNGSPCIYGGQPLGVISLNGSDEGHTVELSTEALADYLAFSTSVTGGKSAFLLTRRDKGSNVVSIAARGHSSLEPARVSWSDAADFVLADGEQPPSGQFTGEQVWEGTLKVPVGSGQYLVLPGATVSVTYAYGLIQSMHGTVDGTPQLPGLGMFSLVDLSAGQFEFGWDVPGSFGVDDGPLKSDTRYAFLRATGGGVSVGPVELDVGVGGETIIAFDPSTTTMYGFTDQLPPMPIPIESAAVGFSANDGLRFTPVSNKGVSDVLTPFDANAYVGATLGFDLMENGPVSLAMGLTGEAFLDADVSGFELSDPDWLRRVGFNGVGEVSVGVGPASVAMDFAHASVRIDPRGASGSAAYPRFVLAGDADNDGIPNWVPLAFKSGMHVAAVVDLNSASASFVQLSGDFESISVPEMGSVRLDGKVLLQSASASVDVTASIAGESFGMAGLVDADEGSVQLDGHMKLHAPGGSGWSFDIEFDPRLKVGPNGPSLTFRNKEAKACGNLGWGKECVTASGIIKQFDFINDKLKVCVDIPLIGKKCETWNP